GYHWLRIVTQPVLLLVFMVCALFLPAVTLHFYLIFPRPKAFLERHWRWVLAIVYGMPLFFFLLLLSGYLRVQWIYRGGPVSGLIVPVEPGSPGDVTTTGVRLLLLEMLAEIYVYFAIAALWYLGSVASLIHSYRTAANPMERQQVKWILLGALAASVPMG